MHVPPLLLSRPVGLQVAIAVVVPALFGLLAGYLLTVDQTAYFVVSALGVLGGIGAGFEHPNPGEGAARGFAGGLLFGTMILLGAALVGDPATAHLPEPVGLLVVITTVLGVAFGALGGMLRRRRAPAPRKRVSR
jgi:hypothetical protein